MGMASLPRCGVERGFAFGARPRAEILDFIFHEICPRNEIPEITQQTEKQPIIREALYRCAELRK